MHFHVFKNIYKYLTLWPTLRVPIVDVHKCMCLNTYMDLYKKYVYVYIYIYIYVYIYICIYIYNIYMSVYNIYVCIYTHKPHTQTMIDRIHLVY